MDEAPSPAAKSAARGRALAVAALLGLAVAGWAAFQWHELLVAHAGGQVFCVGGGSHCAEVWDSPFASAVHAYTALPVAGWGVVWGIAAFAVPLVARVRSGRRRVAEPWVGGTIAIAFAGALGVLVLLAASYAFGHFCSTCGVTYALVLAYAAVALFGLGFVTGPEMTRGTLLAAGFAAVAYAALFVPGLRTPRNVAEAGAQAVKSAASPPPSSPMTGGTPEEREIVRFIETLSPDVQQLLSDTLAAYQAAPIWTPPPARTVVGAAQPRLALTEWTDTLCSHCAQMYEVLVQLRERFGPSAFSLEPHQYPLDPLCNPNVHVPQSQPIRCLAAKVLICAEGKPNEFEFMGDLFRNQSSLNDAMLWKFAAQVGTKADLEACVNTPDTAKKLTDDMKWATDHGIQGTPLLLISGRQAIAFPPLIYVLALSRGAVTSPAYAGLPTPQPLPWQK
ncbi:MAG TPA: thioredoxin domain-containing protein [Myxococcota bacterium]|nr:thioredoxin domain-containing protein [Myxococcota bacterium]